MESADAQPLPDPLTRADAQASRRRILGAAMTLLADRRATMAEVAAAAGVGRSTLYRHFPTRLALEQALRDQPPRQRGVSRAEIVPLPYQAAGHLGRDRPVALEVTRVLDEVPPHLVADQLVAEARRAGGVPCALYVVDIDGSHLLRLAGSEDFPERLEDPPALGPELVPERLAGLYDRLAEELPGCVAEPLWLRGRVVGLLLCSGQPVIALEDMAKQGAAALELSGDYTDFIAAARRRKPTTPAAEIQLNLLPPRITRVAGAQIAGVLLPSYEVGGDWFDYVENRGGAGVAIADAAGTGATAAGLGAATLGALRAARRAGSDLLEALELMDDTVRRLGDPDFAVSAVVARWNAPTSTLRWVNCGHVDPCLVGLDGELTLLRGPGRGPLGDRDAPPRDFTVSERRLHPGERLILLTDGITERRVTQGGTFGFDGLARAVAAAEHPTAAGTALAIQEAVTRCWSEPLQDDATVVVASIA
jgi:AcrR family transcriptional regulator